MGVGGGLCSLPVFDLRPNYGGGNEDNGDLLQKSALSTALSARNPAAGHRRPTPLLETPGHSQASLGQSLVGSVLLSPRFWCTCGFVCTLQESVSPVLWKVCDQIPLPSKVKFPGVSQSFCQIPQVGKSVVGPRTILTV